MTGEAFTDTEIALETVLHEWMIVGTDIFLGRLTAQEVHDRGKELMDELADKIEEAWDAHVRGVEEENDDLTERVEELEKELEQFKKRKGKT